MALRTLRPMHLLYVLVLLVSFFGQGCVTSSEGDRLAAESRSHGQRLEALERRVQAVETKLKEVEDVLSRSTQIVARKSADLAVEIRALEEKLQAADGRFAELQHALEQAREEWKGKLDTITRKAGADMQLSSSEIPSSKEAHFQAAQQAYRQSDYPKARALFREYVSRYAQDDLADNAQYWIGASYLRENQPARALGEYRKVISMQPTRPCSIWPTPSTSSMPAATRKPRSRPCSATTSALPCCPDRRRCCSRSSRRPKATVATEKRSRRASGSR